MKSLFHNTTIVYIIVAITVSGYMYIHIAGNVWGYLKIEIVNNNYFDVKEPS